MTTSDPLRIALERALTDFEVLPDALTDEATLEDLGLDSLAVVELTDRLATDLGRDLADDTLQPHMTLLHAVTALRSPR
ncbi:acyl carrier protein [Streptomyces sp. ITFR-16]|uniref:acyl carrier protein n=1 Tax=Streptomyces sp. ITFR-16 TaxID=3075198 RepID=UPI00288C4F1D|nr:acyl carrier protein [Streptomyces sp. ITFR-16]WNI27196.1 acyl carrier protein [Streptomyces sp. ITFR-16]